MIGLPVGPLSDVFGSWADEVVVCSAAPREGVDPGQGGKEPGHGTVTVWQIKIHLLSVLHPDDRVACRSSSTTRTICAGERDAALTVRVVNVCDR